MAKGLVTTNTRHPGHPVSASLGRCATATHSATWMGSAPCELSPMSCRSAARVLGPCEAGKIHSFSKTNRPQLIWLVERRSVLIASLLVVGWPLTETRQAGYS